MQNQENCYENVWILSGTSDGPNLANMLLELEYIVFASVVTNRAVKSYSQNPKLHIITGKLKSPDQIIKFIKKNKIKFIVDATHPFALIISEYLHKACEQISIPLFVFQRKSSVKKSENFNFISSLKDIDKTILENKNILLAIGSRLLNDTALHYMKYGANVFTRVLPTPEGISRAFGSCIKKSNIAILEPSKSEEGILEKKLCDFWKIDYILCRESGSYSQKIWERISSGSEIRLFLVEKPKLKYKSSFFFSEYSSLIKHIAKES